MSDQTSEPRGPRGTEHPGIPAGHPIRPAQHPDLVAPKAKPKQALPQVMPPGSMLRGGGGRR